MTPDVIIYSDLWPFGDRSLSYLQEHIPWSQGVINIYGRTINEPRLTALFGVDYTYSNSLRKGLPWTDELLRLRSVAEEMSETEFNSCLLNYYRDGNDSIGLHADDEPALGENPIITTLSFGASRIMEFHHNDGGPVHSVFMRHGDMLVMRGDTQKNWKHTIKKDGKCKDPRISLTFRYINS